MHNDKSLYKKLKNKYGNEQVLVIETNKLTNIPDKFTSINDPINESIARPDNLETIGMYINRYDAEYNNATQQVIPYCVIRNATGDKFFISKRISGEPRLLKVLSLGYGGHINPIDGINNAVMDGLNRELLEELSIPGINYGPTFIGYARDLTSELTDHIGFIYELRVTNMKKTKVKEVESLEGRWVTLKELVNEYYNFEGWSKYLIDYYFLQNGCEV